MYELRLLDEEHFEIYNKRRKKVVFSGKDKLISSYEGIAKFKDVNHLMSAINKNISVATYKKISNTLCSW